MRLLWQHGDMSLIGVTRALKAGTSYALYVLETLQVRGLVSRSERLGDGFFYFLTRQGREFAVLFKLVPTGARSRSAGGQAGRGRRTAKHPPSGSTRTRQAATDDARLLAFRRLRAKNPAPLALSCEPGSEEDQWAERIMRKGRLVRTTLGYMLPEDVNE
jgi:hypothetical protein